jgi:hypothetical protein
MNDNKFNNQEWLKEFSTFLSVDEIRPPAHVEAAIKTAVERSLNPNPWSVFSKVAFVQVIVGFISLLFCPQFGFSPTGTMGLMSILMSYGMGVCMAGCGFFFLGSSLLSSSLVLRPEEVQVLYRNRFLQIALVSLLAVGTFLCLGAEIFEVLTLSWMGGSIVGGLISLEVGWKFRKWIRNRIVYG